MAGIAIVLGLMILVPEISMAQVIGGGDLKGKVDGITKGITNFLLPAVSILGLVYSAILAASGDSEAKSRMVLIMCASIVGFLAPLIIRWLQGLAG